MGEYSKFNIVYRLQRWMDSVPGQTFLNYAYSLGAYVVIAGALFKLTHLPGANFMMFLGMGTEVVVFFLSAFDRPFDKTADGRDIPTHVTEEYLETGKVTYEEGRVASSQASPVGNVRPSVVVVGNPQASSSASTISMPDPEVNDSLEKPVQTVACGSDDSTQQSVANGVWIGSQQNTTPEMAEAQSNYVEELKKLVETLEKVNEQSNRLTRDSEEMENLNRTLTGISKVYEMQLKGASQQIGTIDQINEQSRKMAQQIEQLNKIYTRMIEAMTVNMRAAAPHVSED